MQSVTYNTYITEYATEAAFIERKEKYKSNCSISIKQQLTIVPVRNPISFYTSGIIYSMDRYGDLLSYTKNTTLDKDHIPSERALIEHFLLKTTNYTLKNNGTSIAINKEDHKLGSRTHSYRNKRVSPTDPRALYLVDSKNLLSATIKDLAFFTTYMYINGLNHKDYKNAGMLLLAKNYALCLYSK